MFYFFKQSRVLWIAVLMLGLTAVFTPKQAYALVRLVDPVGADVGNCTVSPCQTIAYAHSVAVNGDTISLAAGSYTEYGITITKEVNIKGAGIGTTIIDAAGYNRHFTFSTTVPQARLRDLTLQDGDANLFPGGSVLVENGVDLEVLNVELIDNVGFDGGAIACQQCNRLEVDNSLFSGNEAGRYGGAIFTNVGTVNIDNSTLEDNTADAGGAIYKTSGRVIVKDSAFSGNHADNGDGGGIYSLTGNLKVESSLLTNNSTVANGGGIYASGSGILRLFNSTLSSNSAAQGGGLFAADPIQARTASNTFYGNEATFGTGGAIVSTTTVDLLIANTIISSSISNDCNIIGMNPLGNHNYIDDATCHSAPPAYFDLGIVVVGVDIDPTLQNNGGPTDTHMLPANSVAIDQGSGGCNHPTLGTPLTHDQRGTVRPLGLACDVGAVEAG